MHLDELNALGSEQAAREFLRCCGSTRWAREMAATRPFATDDALMDAGDRIWSSLGPEDWREAFAAHPMIGVAGRAGGAGTAGKAGRAGVSGDAAWAAEEQSGVNLAAADVLTRLARANRDYEARFGYIFIVCATGKSADEMLAILESRLLNEPDVELSVAAGEQRQITRLRLGKLLGRERLPAG